MGSVCARTTAYTHFLRSPVAYLDEETVLTDELRGYREYAQHVRYRLVPFVW